MPRKKKKSDQTLPDLEYIYISPGLLRTIQNFRVPKYAEEEDHTPVVFTINRKRLQVGDEVYFKQKDTNLIVKSIEEIGKDIVVSFVDGTEMLTDSLLIGVYKI